MGYNLENNQKLEKEFEWRWGNQISVCMTERLRF